MEGCNTEERGGETERESRRGYGPKRRHKHLKKCAAYGQTRQGLQRQAWGAAGGAREGEGDEEGRERRVWVAVAVMTQRGIERRWNQRTSKLQGAKGPMEQGNGWQEERAFGRRADWKKNGGEGRRREEMRRRAHRQRPRPAGVSLLVDTGARDAEPVKCQLSCCAF